MNNEELLKSLQNERFKQIAVLLNECLANADDENNCSNDENEMYADMENLKESIEKCIDYNL